MQKIAPCLWFDSQAEEAANFYVDVFKGAPASKGVCEVGDISRYTDVGQEIHGRPPGSVMTVNFKIMGHDFIALNGGPIFKFSEAVSFSIQCGDQEEADYFWDKLTADGGEESQCGWLKDKFGLSWQINPTRLVELLNDPDAKKAGRVMAAMLRMKKIDIQKLEEAYKGGK